MYCVFIVSGLFVPLTLYIERVLDGRDDHRVTDGW